EDIHTQPNGDLAGGVRVDYKWKLFVGDRIIDRIGGKEFDGVYNIHTQPNGDLAGIVEIDSEWKPFIFDGKDYVFYDKINKKD
ncbi:MAG: hypothetical protein L3J07_04825, partial [Candidatus Magasanikbacteria bacterium]|nr:hypothetical protein [Candidatus Magasanikbacteria bacterium]